MHMTLHRLGGLMTRARGDHAGPQDVVRAMAAIEQRVRERGPSKLARRLRRKRELGLGLAGAF